MDEFAGIPLENRIIMGILNLSSETFYQGSFVEGVEDAVARAERMVEEGAQIVDLGGMSTGPGVEPISVEEEKGLLLPPLKEIRREIQVPISVDTQRAEVAEEALKTGADMINDVSGFKADSDMPEVVSAFDCPAILMANRISGRIRTAEKGRRDIQTMKEIKEGLRESLRICEDHEISLSKVSLDPGIGFGRGKDWDLKVIAQLDDLSEFGRPICVGVSRKSFIGQVLDLDDPADRLVGSLGATAVAVMRGADIIRTHDPLETRQLVRMMEAILREEVN